MSFAYFCVFIVLVLVIMAIGSIVSYVSDDAGIPWLILSFGFAFCLTLLLIQNGLI